MMWRVLTLLFAFSLFGNEMEERISSLESQMEEVGTKTANEGYGSRFTSDTFEKGSFGIEFFGSVLYWHAKVGGSEYVYNLARKRRVASQSFDWDFGYRIGVGVRLPILSWEVVGIYTHFGTQDHEGKGIVPPFFLVNLKGAFITPNNRAKSSYKIDYDALRLELKRSSFLSRLFGLGTTIGVKQAWVEQKQTVTYRTSGQGLLKVRDRCHFEGIGPRIGLLGRWYLFSGFSLVTDVAASLLYGQYDVKHTEGTIVLKGKDHLFSPGLDFFLGLHWDHLLDFAQVGIRLGYEADYLWRQNQAIQMVDTIGSGNHFRLALGRNADDLTFYGVSLRVGIEF